MAAIIIICLISLVSCTEDVEKNTSNTNTSQSNETETEDTASIVTKIVPGMTYAEVRALIGSDGTEIGSGAILYEWSFKDGEKLFVWFSNSDSTDATIPDNLIVTESDLESNRKQ